MRQLARIASWWELLPDQYAVSVSVKINHYQFRYFIKMLYDFSGHDSVKSTFILREIWNNILHARKCEIVCKSFLCYYEITSTVCPLCLCHGYQPSSGTLLQICTKLTNLNIPSNEIYEFRDITDQGVKPKWYYRYIYCLFYNSLPEQTQTTFYVSAIKM